MRPSRRRSLSPGRNCHAPFRLRPIRCRECDRRSRIARLSACARRLGKSQEHRLRHDEQSHVALGRGLCRYYPNIKIEIEGHGSSTAPPALIAGTADFGPMSRDMKAQEIDEFQSKFGYPPTSLSAGIDMLAVYVHKDNPVAGPVAARTRCDLLQESQAGARPGYSHLGRSQTAGAMGHVAHQPLRPQCGVGHLWILQVQGAGRGRLQGFGQRAARQFVGGARCGQRTIRHRL